MNLQLVALSGPQGGKSFSVVVGHRIGRRKVEILLDDAKISNQHAAFVEIGGLVFLRDLGSKNGLWLNGTRADQILLSPGVVFIIGNTEFRVEEVSQYSSSSSHLNSSREPTLPPPPPIIERPQSSAPTPAPAPIEDAIELARVESTLEKFLKRASKDTKDKPRVLVPFVPALKLRFLRGLQTEQEWRVTFGPRSCGNHSLDLTLHEPEAPAVCFELLPTPRGIALKTSHSDIVKVNDVAASTHVLKTGDLITILDTCLEVEFE